ncbi:hypothetical protein DPMN_062829 [Dreissena polymorpha]|uniref:Uncharacterized protein n=1 Tax=Dreissena polymorpha TaxID=45954 RepID=A0A9D4HJL5_DREPO|nr:hypothetical protein DPMN_062829 [Dreissena polymorpha]
MAANLSRATTEHVRITFTNCTPLIDMTSVKSPGLKSWIAAVPWHGHIAIVQS